MASPDDLQARLTHLYDQTLATLIEQAPVLARYYDALRESGMPEGPAMALVLITHLRWIGGIDILVGGEREQ